MFYSEDYKIIIIQLFLKRYQFYGLPVSRDFTICSQKIAKILRNKHSVFVPNEAIFYPGKKFDSGQILITC